MKLSKNIAYLRKTIGLSQEGLAEKLNLSRQAIAKWENGSSEPNVSALVSMSNLFNISLDELILKEFCKPNNSNKSNSSSEKPNLRIVELSGYDISDMVLNFTVTGEIQTSILYLTSFDGVIFHETPMNFGTTANPNHESLKRLFYKIATDMIRLGPVDWYMITDISPTNLKPFLTWLKNDFEDVDRIDTLYILHEENPDYDYKFSFKDISIFCMESPSPADFESEMKFLKKCMEQQEYEGPFPPARIYKKILEDAPGHDLPHWFMTGDFSK